MNDSKKRNKKWDEYRKSLKKQDEQWKEWKKSLDNVPSYLVLQRASILVLDYSHEKRPIGVSWYDREDDFIELWQKLEQIGLDLCKVATIDKALKTVRDFHVDGVSS